MVKTLKGEILIDVNDKGTGSNMATNKRSYAKLPLHLFQT
jgi:hypothetical protein